MPIFSLERSKAAGASLQLKGLSCPASPISSAQLCFCLRVLINSLLLDADNHLLVTLKPPLCSSRLYDTLNSWLRSMLWYRLSLPISYRQNSCGMSMVFPSGMVFLGVLVAVYSKSSFSWQMLGRRQSTSPDVLLLRLLACRFILTTLFFSFSPSRSGSNLSPSIVLPSPPELSSFIIPSLSPAPPAISCMQERIKQCLGLSSPTFSFLLFLRNSLTESFISLRLAWMNEIWSILLQRWPLCMLEKIRLIDVINDHHFWIRVPSATSLAYTVEDRLRGLGGNPPKSWKVETPLTVEMWLQTSCREESRFAYMVIVEPFCSLTRIVVTYRLLLGSRMKFSAALDFLANLTSLAGSEREAPLPENSTYLGGGGGMYFSSVLSERLMDSSPLGYLTLNSGGILPSFNIFMNCLFLGSLQSLNSPSSMVKPFSQRVILQTLLLLSFSSFLNSYGVLHHIKDTQSSFRPCS